MTTATARRADRARLLPAVVALVMTAALTPMPAARAGTSFTFSGGGFGHSVGMSQFGAYGMSREGYTWSQILTHYFTGATPGAVDSDLALRPLWVNLQVEQASVAFVVRTTGTLPAASVTFSSNGGTVTAVAGETVRVTRSGDTCTISAPGGSVSGGCSVDAEWDGRTASPTTALVIDGCFQTNWNLTTGSRQQPCTYARGAIHLRPDNNTATLAISLEVAMEDYVLGISEMPYYWAASGGAAALEAQAVGARSYAYARMLARGTPESRPWCWCQVYDTPVDQNYVGWGHGTQAWIDAVRNTAGQVMYHPGTTRNGVQVPVETFYSSSTFGATENSEDAFTGRAAYLRSIDDHWSGASGVGNGNYRWTRTYSDSQLAAILPGMSSVTGATITRCSTSGAALEITFSGSGGPKTFHVRQLRGLLGLRSQQIYAINGTAPCTAGAPATTTTTTSTTTTTVPDTTTTMPDDSGTTTTTIVGDTTTTTPATETTTTTVPVTTTTVVVSTTTTTAAPTTTVPPTTTTTIPAPACVVTLPSIEALVRVGVSLRSGSQGPAVTQLQVLLKLLGHYEGTADGYYGRLTTAAVRSFQDSRGLAVDGVVGSRTRSELVALHAAAERGRILSADPGLLRRGAYGAAVAALQFLLERLGYSPGPIDGAFGSRTDTAVAAFQRSQALTVDGVVGDRSKAALARALGLDGLLSCR